MKHRPLRILSLILCFSLILPLISFPPAKAASYGNLKYKIVNGEVTITGSNEAAVTEVVIPDTIDGCPVTAIGDQAFYLCDSLTSVSIPDSVTSIGYFAFGECRVLSSVNIPEGVTSIGSSAFSYCRSLASVTIPSSVSSTGNYAFSSCTNLRNVTIRDGVTEIGNGSFFGCDSLKSVTIPDSVTSIGDAAFSSCTDLQEIHFEGNAPTFGTDAFSEVTAEAYYPADNDTWTDSVKQSYGGSITWVATETALPGDLNGNGTVNIADVALLYCHVRGTDTLSEDSLSLADLNGDGKITIIDVAILYIQIRA